ncbi:response regulator [Methylococcus geothermalis]|uniref:Response regulator n=1 Tax=Methylococcus geothermalis TaxID=2681310 RepID=A0A858Q949_9GAMM|nr:response regulator [Methylococcus geothermalis]QJD30305.1 response regulator [Methylococcus geothermalis]
MRILLVEDDAMIGKSVQLGLKREGYAVDWVRDGLAAERALANDVHELLILDLGIPRKPGLDVLKTLRARRNPMPVLIITARDSVADRVAGLDSGADDYLVKPFDLEELSARVRALARRRSGRPTPLIEHDGLTVNPMTHEVWLNDVPVRLSAREYALLTALLEHPDMPLSRGQLEERIYGWGEEVESNTIEVYIHSLRRKLGTQRIVNVRGVGYLMPRQT